MVSTMTQNAALRRNVIGWVTMTYLALGLVALAAGVASFLRHENQRVAGMAGALGIIVIGWEYVLIGVLVAVVLLIVMSIGPS